MYAVCIWGGLAVYNLVECLQLDAAGFEGGWRRYVIAGTSRRMIA